MQGTRRKDLRNDQSGDNRLLFRCAALANISVAGSGPVLSEDWELHRVREQCSVARAATPRDQALPQTRKDSLRRRRAPDLRPRCELVGPMVVLAAWLPGHHG